MKTINYFKIIFLGFAILQSSLIHAQETPFNCDYNAYLFQNNDVFALDLASGNSYQVATDVVPGKINATGYNPTDGYIWGAVSTPSRTIVRIGKNFETTFYTIPELPDSNRFVGDVSSEGIFYLKQGGNGFHKINIDPDSSNYGTYLEAGTLSTSLNIHDWAFNAVDGKLYSVEKGSNKLLRINATTGNVIDLGVVPILNGFNYTYGAVYFDASGRFYVSANQTGTIFVIQSVQNLNPNDPIDSNLFAYGPSSSSNDGARCPTAPVPQEICDNGIDDDGDGLIDCDDPSCSGVSDCPIEEITGGNEGGLESNNRLSEKINTRNYQRSRSGKKFNVNNAPVFNPNVAKASQNRSSDISLSEFVPTNIIPGATQIESTPSDLIPITNATDILSIDYVRQAETIAALMILKTENGVYEHTKYICDRLLGSELQSVSTVEINGNNFIRSIIKNKNGQKEFVLSLSAKMINSDADFEIENHWNLSSYEENKSFYNFQIWSNSLENLMKMSQEVLNLIEIQKPIVSYKTSPPPTVFLKKGIYKDGQLELEIINTNKSEMLFIEGGLRPSETSPIQNVSTEISLDGSYLSKHIVDFGGLFDLGFSIRNERQETPDDVFLADGPWGVDDFASSTMVQSFDVSPQESTSTTEGYSIERNISLIASTREYVSVYRAFTPKFQAVDLSDLNSLQFEGSGTGNLVITLVSNNIASWEEQYTANVLLTNNSTQYTIPYSRFKSSLGVPMDPSALTSLVLTMTSENQVQESKQMTISNVVFTNMPFASSGFLDDIENLVLAPNPVNETSKLHFYAETKSDVEFLLFDLLGKLIYQQSIVTEAGLNTVPITPKDLESGIYVYQLIGSTINYKPGKLISK